MAREGETDTLPVRPLEASSQNLYNRRTAKPTLSLEPDSTFESHQQGATHNGQHNIDEREDSPAHQQILGDTRLTNGGVNGIKTTAVSSQRIVPKEAEASAIRKHPPLVRTRSDQGPRNKHNGMVSPAEDKLSNIRHGWDDEYNSDEYLSLLNSTFFMYYTDKRHESNGNESYDSKQYPSSSWRMKDRMKTVSAALAICLNIGVDPPDVIKTNPCAKLEAWRDPGVSTGGNTKTMEDIGKRLQEQYESLSLRTRYKQYLDPSIDETKRFCVSLRRNAKDERVLFHYNGHGVPLPTASGELWVFNRNYTQYIPVGIYDLQSWLAGPSLFVYDVSHAGNILHNFDTFLAKHEKENDEIRRRDPAAPIQNYGDCIQLAACGRNEMLPTNPDLPADLFTSCLTTPIDIALRWFVLQSPLPLDVAITDAKIDVPGKLQDRRSPLGELNWIFTAITDTIAWNLLPRDLFKKLFRQDLMVAALFRNFLLSERIMRANQCHPISSPTLPETHHHPLWQSWDLALDNVLAQLPDLQRQKEAAAKAGQQIEYEYHHSTFFAEQLTAFEVYLSSGPSRDQAPDQLPIVLQVLLSQVHRLRALILLSRFLDLGPWAVHLALSIGIFPYVVKLLGAASVELKPVMVFIWARIMAVDNSVQTDLLKDNGIHYFISIINPNSDLPVMNSSEHRAMCAFIIAIFCNNYPRGQTVCLLPDLFRSCLHNMDEPENPLLRQWSCLCLSTLWADYSDAKWMGIREGAHVKLCDLGLDPVPEVRASMLHALTNFLAIPDLTDQVAQIEEGIAARVLFMTSDGSPLVRKELLVFFSTFVKRYENKFMIVAFEQLMEERNRHPSKSDDLDDRIDQLSAMNLSDNTIYGTVWTQVMIMSVDPHPEVSQSAGMIVDSIHEALVHSPLREMVLAVIDDLLRLAKREEMKVKKSSSNTSLRSLREPPSTPSPQSEHQKSYLSLSGLKSSMRLLGFGSTQESSSNENTPAKPATKPVHPIPPTNTPRGRLPAEWSRPPENNDQTSSVGQYHQAPIPPPAGYNPKSTPSQPSIPIRSALLEWSTEYFREPQMRSQDPDEPGSNDYNQRLWRRSRNEKIIADSQPLKSIASTSKWTRVESLINNNLQPMRLAFHQYDDHLAVTDDRDTVSIWDWQQNQLLSRFSNDNPKGSRINDTRFVNEDDHQPLLMVGSSDGVLKVYRQYWEPKNVKLVAGWRVLTDLISSNRNAGLVFDWQQGQGRVLAAGDVKVIKVWNAATELCVNDIPARSGSCITSMTSDQVAGDIFVAGFGDGVVRAFDQRMHPRSAMVKVWREHRQWITNVKMQRGGVRELVSASRNGEVKLWDLRHDKSVLSMNVQSQGETVRSMSVHEHAPVLAVGMERHEVKNYNMTGESLGVYEPVVGGAKIVGGLGRRNAITATAYHPHKMILAVAGLGDGFVNLVSY